VPNVWMLRRIATGFKALRQPTDGRQSYLMRELAEAFGVNESTIFRWIERGYIRADRSPAGFIIVPVAEAMRFSREGPTRPAPATGRQRNRDSATGHFLKGSPLTRRQNEKRPAEDESAGRHDEDENRTTPTPLRKALNHRERG
jgi:hypothetical protein